MNGGQVQDPKFSTRGRPTLEIHDFIQGFGSDPLGPLYPPAFILPPGSDLDPWMSNVEDRSFKHLCVHLFSFSLIIHFISSCCLHYFRKSLDAASRSGSP